MQDEKPGEKPGQRPSRPLGHREFDDLVAAGCPSCAGQFLRA